MGLAPGSGCSHSAGARLRRKRCCGSRTTLLSVPFQVDRLLAIADFGPPDEKDFEQNDRSHSEVLGVKIPTQLFGRNTTEPNIAMRLNSENRDIKVNLYIVCLRRFCKLKINVLL